MNVLPLADSTKMTVHRHQFGGSPDIRGRRSRSLGARVQLGHDHFEDDALRFTFHTRAELALENLALRQHLANLRHTSGRPRIRMADRAFWLVLSRLWSRWADVFVIVKPDTVVRWHRAGFRLFWR